MLFLAHFRYLSSDSFFSSPSTIQSTIHRCWLFVPDCLAYLCSGIAFFFAFSSLRKMVVCLCILDRSVAGNQFFKPFRDIFEMSLHYPSVAFLTSRFLPSSIQYLRHSWLLALVVPCTVCLFYREISQVCEGDDSLDFACSLTSSGLSETMK